MVGVRPALLHTPPPYDTVHTELLLRVSPDTSTPVTATQTAGASAGLIGVNAGERLMVRLWRLQASRVFVLRLVPPPPQITWPGCPAAGRGTMGWFPTDAIRPRAADEVPSGDPVRYWEVYLQRGPPSGLQVQESEFRRVQALPDSAGLGGAEGPSSETNPPQQERI